MCGFAGIISKSNLDKKESKKIIQNMTNQIIHRGPDSKGLYLGERFNLGFRRLSILDISKKANQPFTDLYQNYILAFNGEIYNFIELKKKYFKNFNFKSHSDTEVLFHLLIKYGMNILNEIEGMFSFIFYDKIKNKIYLSRDHFGIKPLFYVVLNKKIYFSSEVKSFKNIFKFEINNSKIFENILWGNIAGEDTLYRNIKQVKPGFFYEINGSLSIKKKRFFDLKKTFFNKGPNIKLIEKKLLNTIKKHLRSDVKIGLLLSGGLDSSILAMIIKKINRNKRIFTLSTSISNSQLDESKNQSIIQNLIKSSHNKISFTSNSILKNIKKCIFYYEAPLHDPNIIAINDLCNLAKRKKIKVLLAGDGSDELFGGYKWSNIFKQKKSIYSNSMIDNDIIFKVFNIKKRNFKERNRLLKKNLQDHKFQRIYDQSFHLDKWLQRQDKIGMANSIEIRVPFCDISFVKTVNRFNQMKKINNKKISKYILKKIFEKYLPKNIIYQDKKGFTIPLDDYFRSKILKNFFKKIISSNDFKKRKIYRHQNIKKIFLEHINFKKNHGKILWSILNLELWQKEFIDR